MSPGVAVNHAAGGFVELLWELGVELFLGNLGSDAPSVIDAFARLAAEGRPGPRGVQVAHEMVAVSAAHGYYLASGKPAVVMVHSTVGTANALTGVINAARAHVPLVLVAGRTSHRAAAAVPRTLEPHWAQETADQGALVRGYTKWDYELRSAEQLEEVVRRAFAIAMSEPRGPVYLVLPMDLMAAPLESFEPRRPPAKAPWGASAAPHPDPAALDAAADLLAAASQPLIITRSYGRRPGAVSALVELAQTFALPVVEHQVPDCVNFPASHPFHLGYDPTPYLAEADVVLVLDSPVPWVPALGAPGAGTRVIHAAPDPLRSDYPAWSFRLDLGLAGDPVAAVEGLIGRLRQRQRSARGAIDRRAGRLRRRHQALQEEWAVEIRDLDPDGPASAAWISHCLRPHLGSDTVVVQEYDLKLRHTGFEAPGDYFGFSPAGGLGFGVGGALGVKLACSEETVIAVVGDGTYLLGVPTAAHLLSVAEELPVLWIVVNNHGWGAVKEQVRQVHPKGWSEKAGEYPFIRFGHDVRYEVLVRACDGSGEAVATAAALPGALERALRVVREEGRQALLAVECGEPSFQL